MATRFQFESPAAEGATPASTQNSAFPWTNSDEYHPVEPLDPEKMVEEWRQFLTMVQRMILERFHFRSLDGKDLIDNLVWWWKKLNERLPQLRQYFDEHPHRDMYTLSDLCSDDEVQAYWKYFGFQFIPDEDTFLESEEIQEVLDNLMQRAPSRQGSMLVR